MTEYIIPLVVALIVFVCLVKGVPLFDTVTDGIGEGMKIVIKILPTMIAVLMSVKMLTASGALDALINLLAPITNFLKIPDGVMPMALMRPVSGSGSLGILSDILARFGPDSREGRIASVIMGSTETTFYTLAVYFGATSVKKTGWAIPAALIADVVGVLVAVKLIT